jgi:hypothetical protein
MFLPQKRSIARFAFIRQQLPRGLSQYNGASGVLHPKGALLNCASGGSMPAINL